MQSMDVGPLVPDFLSSELFTAPDACNWSCGMGDSFDINSWDVDCFGHAQLGDAQAGGPVLCQVPDAGELLAEELSVASSTMTSVQLATFSPTSPAQVQRDDAACSPTEGGRAVLGAGTGSVVTCSGGARPKLQLDYSNVLSAWQAMGGSIAVGEEVSMSSSITLRLPSASDSVNCALPSYNMCHAPRVLPLPLGTADASPKLGENSLMLGSFAGGDGSAPMRRASLQSTAGSRLGAPLADDLLLGMGDSDCGSDDSLAEALLSCGFDAGGVSGDGLSRGFAGAGSLHGSSSCFSSGMGVASGNCFSIGGSPLMPPIPSLRSAAYSCGALSALCMPGLPQSLASIPAKTTECAKSARAACFVRYKEKKQNRKSGKIRYEMRKINAEKRPRFRGRFVKREELMMMLAAEQEELSPRSDASAADCAPLWQFNQ